MNKRIIIYIIFAVIIILAGLIPALSDVSSNGMPVSTTGGIPPVGIIVTAITSGVLLTICKSKRLISIPRKLLMFMGIISLIGSVLAVAVNILVALNVIQ